MSLTIKKFISVTLTIIYSTTQIVLGSVLESNLWKDRQNALSARKAAQEKTQLASLPTGPAVPGAASIFHQLPSVSPTLTNRAVLSGIQKKRFGSFSQKFDELIANIPLNFGQIHDVFYSGSDSNPAIVLIQDVHLNPEAQKNIAGIIQTLIEQKRVELVGVEGAFEKFDFSRFRAFPDKAITKEVAEAYLEKNMLAAPSFVGITSPINPPTFIGVDDKFHYDANVQAYLSSRAIKEKIARELENQNREILERKRNTFSPELTAFDNIRTAYQKGQIGLGAYVKHLVIPAKAGIQFVNLPSLKPGFPIKTFGNDVRALSDFLEAYEMESSLDFNRVEVERKAVIEKLAGTLNEKELAALVAQSMAYRTGEIGFGTYYEGLKNLCEVKGVQISKTPAFEKYIRYVILSDGIKPAELFNSLETLEDSTIEKLAKTEPEKRLIREHEKLCLLGKLLEFALTPTEWEKYKKLIGPRERPFDLSSFEAFYKEAEIRSQSMVQKLTGAVIASDRRERSNLIMVTGGFHTPEIANLFKGKKISYIVISPKITKVDDGMGTSYLSIFAREKTPIDKLFTGEKLFISPSSVAGIGTPDVAKVGTNQFFSDDAARTRIARGDDGDRQIETEVLPDGQVAVRSPLDGINVVVDTAKLPGEGFKQPVVSIPQRVMGLAKKVLQGLKPSSSAKPWIDLGKRVNARWWLKLAFEYSIYAFFSAHSLLFLPAPFAWNWWVFAMIVGWDLLEAPLPKTFFDRLLSEKGGKLFYGTAVILKFMLLAMLSVLLGQPVMVNILFFLLIDLLKFKLGWDPTGEWHKQRQASGLLKGRYTVLYALTNLFSVALIETGGLQGALALGKSIFGITGLFDPTGISWAAVAIIAVIGIVFSLLHPDLYQALTYQKEDLTSNGKIRWSARLRVFGWRFLGGVVFTSLLFAPGGFFFSYGLHVVANGVIRTGINRGWAGFEKIRTFSVLARGLPPRKFLEGEIERYLQDFPIDRNHPERFDELADKILAAVKPTQITSEKLSQLKSQIVDAIAQRVAQEEQFPVVEFVAAMQGNPTELIGEAVRRGKKTVLAILARVSKSAVDIFRRAIRSLVHNQFTNLSARPVIEILLNAIDTEERLNFRKRVNLEKRVQLYIQDGRAMIRDWGEGISLQDLTKLLNPGEGGNLAQSGTTGRFGAGFLSIFSYLTGPDDRVVIRTVSGSEANRCEFSLGDDGQLMMSTLTLSPSEAARLAQGSEIEIVSPSIQRNAVLTEAKKILRHKSDAVIEVMDEEHWLLNPQAGLRKIAEVKEKVSMRIPPQTPATGRGQQTEVHILINGVYFDTIGFETFGEFREVVLDFHKDLFDYARDRDKIKSTQAVLKALESLIDELAARFASRPDLFCRMANLLYPVVESLQKDTPPGKTKRQSADPIEKLKSGVEEILLRSQNLDKWLVLEDDLVLRESIGPSRTNIIFLRKELLPRGKQQIPDQMRDARYRQVVYVPLNQSKGALWAKLAKGGVLLVDPSLKEAINNPERQDEALVILQAIADVSRAAHEGAEIEPFIQKERPSPLQELGETVGRQSARVRENEPVFELHRFFSNGVRNARSRNEFILWDRLSGVTSVPDELKNLLPQRFWESLPDRFRPLFETDGRPIMPALSIEAREVISKYQLEDKGLYQLSRFIEEGKIPASNRGVIQEIVVFLIYRELLDRYQRNLQGQADWYRIENPLAFEIYFMGRRYGGVGVRDSFFEVLSSGGYYIPGQFEIIHLFGYPKKENYFQTRFRDLPKYLTNRAWTEVYRSLLFSLYQKNPVGPYDNSGIYQLVNKVNVLFESLVSGLSENESEALLKEFLFLDPNYGLGNIRSFIDEYRFELKDIQRALNTRGLLGARLAAHLHQLFSTFPPLGQKPANAIGLTKPSVAVEVSDLILAMGQSRESESQFKSIQNAGQLQDLAERSPNTDPELKDRARVSIRRAYEQTTDEYAFLREVVTNAYEASRSRPLKEGNVPVFQVRSWFDESGQVVVSMSDEGVGMDLQDIIGKLLQPSASGWASDWLHFGQGFYTLFRSGDEVRVRSTKNGVTTVVYLTPVWQAGHLMDIRARVVQNQTNERPGTTVEWRKRAENPGLLASEIFVRLGHYVGLFDRQKMKVLWNNQLVNDKAEPLAKVTKGSTGEAIEIYAASGERAFNLNQFYMCQLNNNFTYAIPPFFLNLLLKVGIVLNLDSAGAQPLESRTDFVGRSRKMKEFEPALALAGIAAAGRLLEMSRLDLGERLPYDYILNAADYRPKDGSIIAEDAKRVAQGKPVKDVSYYLSGMNAEKNSILLLLSLPVISIEGVKVSCFEAIILGLKNKQVLEKLPPWLQNQIKQAQARAKLSELLIKAIGFAEGIREEVNAAPVDPADPEAYTLLTWQRLVETVLASIDAAIPVAQAVRHEFFASAKLGALAYTELGRFNIAWNVGAIYDKLETLHRLLVHGADGRSLTNDERDDFQHLLYTLIEATTHERTHIQRGESEAEWTHDPAFLKDQLKGLNVVLGRFREAGPGLGILVAVQRTARERAPPKEFLLPAKFKTPSPARRLSTTRLAGSIFDNWAKGRWGEGSWKYILFTVFGVNWEIIFQLSIPLAVTLFPTVMGLGVVMWVMSALAFGFAHRGRTRGQKWRLVGVGLGLGTPFLFASIGWAIPINIVLHSTFNFTKLIIPFLREVFSHERGTLEIDLSMVMSALDPTPQLEPRHIMPITSIEDEGLRQGVAEEVARVVNNSRSERDQIKKDSPSLTEQDRGLFSWVDDRVKEIQRQFSLPNSHEVNTGLRKALDMAIRYEGYQVQENKRLKDFQEKCRFLKPSHELAMRLQNYIDRMKDPAMPGSRLLIAIDGKIPQAFQIGQTVVINMALIRCLDTIDELVGVLAHEQRHYEFIFRNRMSEEGGPWESFDFLKDFFAGIGAGRIQEHDADIATHQKITRVGMNPLALYNALVKIAGRRSLQDSAHGAISTRIVAGYVAYRLKDTESQGSPDLRTFNQPIPLSWKLNWIYPSFDELPFGRRYQDVARSFSNDVLTDTIHKLAAIRLSRNRETSLLFLMNLLEERIQGDPALSQKSIKQREAILMALLHSPQDLLSSVEPNKNLKQTRIGEFLAKKAVGLLSTEEGIDALKQLMQENECLGQQIQWLRLTRLARFMSRLLVEDDKAISSVLGRPVNLSSPSFLTAHAEILSKLRFFFPSEYERDKWLEDSLGMVVSRYSQQFWETHKASKDNLVLLVEDIKKAQFHYQKVFAEYSITVPPLNKNSELLSMFSYQIYFDSVFKVIKNKLEVGDEELKEMLMGSRNPQMQRILSIFARRDTKELLEFMKKEEWLREFNYYMENLGRFDDLFKFIQDNMETTDWLHDALATSWRDIPFEDVGLPLLFDSIYKEDEQVVKVFLRFHAMLGILKCIPARTHQERFDRIQSFLTAPTSRQFIQSLPLRLAAPLADNAVENLYSRNLPDPRPSSENFKTWGNQFLVSPPLDRLRQTFEELIRSNPSPYEANFYFWRIVSVSNSTYGSRTIHVIPQGWNRLVGMTAEHSEWLFELTNAYFDYIQRRLNQPGADPNEAAFLFQLLEEILPPGERKERILNAAAEKIIDRADNDLLVSFLESLVDNGSLTQSIYEYFVKTRVRTWKDYEFFRQRRDRIIGNITAHGGGRLGQFVILDTILDMSLQNNQAERLFVAMMNTGKSEDELKQELVTPWYLASLANGGMSRYSIIIGPGGDVIIQGEGSNNFIPLGDLIQMLLNSSEMTKNFILEKLLLGPNGLLQTKRGRMIFVKLFSERLPKDSPAAAVLKDILSASVQELEPEKIFLAFRSSILPEFLKRPSSPSKENLSRHLAKRLKKDLRGKGWASSISRLLSDLGYDKKIPLGRTKANQFEKFLERYSQRIPPSGSFERLSSRTDKLMESVENNLGIDRSEDAVQKESGPENQAPNAIEIIVRACSSLGPMGVRFLQVLGQYLPIPPETQEKFLDVYDASGGQDAFIAFDTLTSVAKKNPEVRRFMEEEFVAFDGEPVGKGSIVTVFKILVRNKRPDGSFEEIVRDSKGAFVGGVHHEILKVRVPNAEGQVALVADAALRIIERLRKSAGWRDKYKFDVAKRMVEDIKAWIIQDIRDTMFLEVDGLYRRAHEGFVAQNGLAVEVSPAFEPNNKDVKRENFVRGVTLNKILKLIRKMQTRGDAGVTEGLIRSENDPEARNFLEQARAHQQKIQDLLEESTEAAIYDFARHLVQPILIDVNGEPVFILHSDMHFGNVIRSQQPQQPGEKNAVHPIDRNYYLRLSQSDVDFLRWLLKADPADGKNLVLQIVEFFLGCPENKNMPAGRIGRFSPRLWKTIFLLKVGIKIGTMKNPDPAAMLMQVLQELERQGFVVPLRLRIMFKNILAINTMLSTSGAPPFRDFVVKAEQNFGSRIPAITFAPPPGAKSIPHLTFDEAGLAVHDLIQLPQLTLPALEEIVKALPRGTEIERLAKDLDSLARRTDLNLPTVPGYQFLTLAEKELLRQLIEARRTINGRGSARIATPVSILNPFLKWLLNYSWGKPIYWLLTVGFAALWETGAFQYFGMAILPNLLVGWGLAPALAIGLGLIWATAGFSFAHTIVEWIHAVNRVGLGRSFDHRLLRVYGYRFVFRFGLGAVFALPFLPFMPAFILNNAFWISAGIHAAYNAGALAGVLPSKAPVASIFNFIKGKFVFWRFNLKETEKKQERRALTDPSILKTAVMFPPLVNYKLFRRFGSWLYDLNIPEVRAVYDEAAQALELENMAPFFNSWRMFISLDQDQARRVFSIAYVVHHVAYLKYLEYLIRDRNLPIEFDAFSGESIGIAAAAIASGAITLTDYIRYANIVWPYQNVPYEGSSELFTAIVTIAEGNLEEIEANLQQRYAHFETVKYISGNTILVYITKDELEPFKKYLEETYGNKVLLSDLKPFKNIIHSAQLAEHRRTAEDSVRKAGIRFSDPRIPIIANHRPGLLSTGEEVLEGLLSIIDKPMDSRATVAELEKRNPALILEVGLTQSVPVLLSANRSVLPAAQFAKGEDLEKIEREFLEQAGAVEEPTEKSFYGLISKLEHRRPESLNTARVASAANFTFLWNTLPEMEYYGTGRAYSDFEDVIPQFFQENPRLAFEVDFNLVLEGLNSPFHLRRFLSLFVIPYFFRQRPSLATPTVVRRILDQFKDATQGADSPQLRAQNLRWAVIKAVEAVASYTPFVKDHSELAEQSFLTVLEGLVDEGDNVRGAALEALSKFLQIQPFIETHMDLATKAFQVVAYFIRNPRRSPPSSDMKHYLNEPALVESAARIIPAFLGIIPDVVFESGVEAELDRLRDSRVRHVAQSAAGEIRRQKQARIQTGGIDSGKTDLAGSKAAEIRSFHETNRTKLLDLSDLANLLKTRKTISHDENLMLNTLVRVLMDVFQGTEINPKKSYISNWSSQFLAFLSSLFGRDPSTADIQQLHRFMSFGALLERLPNVFYENRSIEIVTRIVDAMVSYLHCDIERPELNRKVMLETGVSAESAEGLIESALFIDEEVRLRLEYEYAERGMRILRVVQGIRPDGSPLTTFLDERGEGAHTFTAKDQEQFIVTTMIPEEWYQEIRLHPAKAHVTIHVGDPGVQFIEALSRDGYKLHSFRKDDHERQYKNRSFYYRRGEDGPLEIQIVHHVGFTNLIHLIHYYLMMGIADVRVVDHMPDYDEMLTRAIENYRIGQPVDVLGIGAGYGMGTYLRNRFTYFSDSFFTTPGQEDPRSPYIIRTLENDRSGKTMVGFNMTNGDLSAYAARAMVERFPEARSVLSAGIIGFLPDENYDLYARDEVLPGDIFIPTSVANNVFEAEINNQYLDSLIEVLEEEEISYQVIDYTGSEKKILEERTFKSDAAPVKIVIGKIFSVDSIAIETVAAMKKLRDRNVRGLDSEAALIVASDPRFFGPQRKLFFGYIISDIPGYLNLGSSKGPPQLRGELSKKYGQDIHGVSFFHDPNAPDVSMELGKLLDKKYRQAIHVLSLTAHRIIQSESPDQIQGDLKNEIQARIPLAVGGLIWWLRGVVRWFFPRLSPKTYDRWVAFWLENVLVAGIVFALTSQFPFTPGMAKWAWGLFVILHLPNLLAIKQGSRALPAWGTVISAIFIACINIYLGFSPLHPVSILIHFVVNLLAPAVFRFINPTIELTQPKEARREGGDSFEDRLQIIISQNKNDPKGLLIGLMRLISPAADSLGIGERFTDAATDVFGDKNKILDLFVKALQDSIVSRQLTPAEARKMAPALATVLCTYSREDFAQFVSSVNDICDTKMRNAQTFVTWADNEAMALKLIQQFATNGNRIVLGMHKDNQNIIDKLKANPQTKPMIDDGRVVLTMGDDQTTLLNFFNKVKLKEQLSNVKNSQLSLLLVDGTRFPAKFFEMSEIDWKLLEQEVVYFVDQALKGAISLESSLLPDWKEYLTRLMQA